MPHEGTERAASARAAYVVLSHGAPEQISRLVRAIRSSSPDCYVFISHDARLRQPPEIDEPGVYVRAHGRETDWGSFEIVLATLDAFRWARTVADPDMVVLISGQDYPARSLETWERSFLALGGWVGDVRPLKYRARWGAGDEGGFDTALLWYNYRWFPLPSFLSDGIPEPLRTQWYRLLHGVFKRIEPVAAYWMLRRGRGPHIGLPRRPAPFSDENPCYKGSQWLAMDRRLLDLVLTRAVAGERLYELFAHSLIPDEAFLQTILSWDTPVRERSAVSYLDWTWAERAESPKVLDSTDLPAIVASGAPFCRKVDHVVSAELLDELDRLIRLVGEPGQ